MIFNIFLNGPDINISRNILMNLIFNEYPVEYALSQTYFGIRNGKIARPVKKSISVRWTGNYVVYLYRRYYLTIGSLVLNPHFRITMSLDSIFQHRSTLGICPVLFEMCRAPLVRAFIISIGQMYLLIGVESWFRRRHMSCLRFDVFGYISTIIVPVWALALDSLILM